MVHDGRNRDARRTVASTDPAALELVAAHGWMSATELAVGAGRRPKHRLAAGAVARGGRLAAPRSGQRSLPAGHAPVRAGDPRPRHHRRARRSPPGHDRAGGLDRRERRPRDPRRRQRRLHRQDRRHRRGPRLHAKRPAGAAPRDRGGQGLPRRDAGRGARDLPRRPAASAYTPPTLTDPTRSRPSSTRPGDAAGRSTVASSLSRRARWRCPCSTRPGAASRPSGSTSRCRGSTTTPRPRRRARAGDGPRRPTLA